MVSPFSALTARGWSPPQRAQATRSRFSVDMDPLNYLPRRFPSCIMDRVEHADPFAPSQNALLRPRAPGRGVAPGGFLLPPGGLFASLHLFPGHGVLLPPDL